MKTMTDIRKPESEAPKTIEKRANWGCIMGVILFLLALAASLLMVQRALSIQFSKAAYYPPSELKVTEHPLTNGKNYDPQPAGHANVVTVNPQP